MTGFLFKYKFLFCQKACFQEKGYETPVYIILICIVPTFTTDFNNFR
jgi:hypothetical protein